MSEEIKCQHCGGEYQDYLTDVGICCFSCGTEPYEEQSRLCKEIVARRKAEDDRQNMWDELHAVTDCLGAGLPDLDPDSGKTPSELVFALKKRARDLTETARIIVEYIEDPERRAFYRNQIEVAGTDAFQKGGAL